ncbi:hypothetical protein [Actinokineospora sp. HUAS TT18]|uniref:hypothetical protein n=1 Tax=Actinokineospora sp. HUAS TT18 TaxID=3447451 RepID=UPI003F51FAE4
MPGHAVEISSEGELIGRATVDESGRFATRLDFRTIAPGRHVVTAHCGVVLSSVIDHILAASTGAATGSAAVLLFVVLVIAALVRVPSRRMAS